MRRVEFHRLARLEAHEASDFLEKERSGFGDFFTDELESNLTYILNNPEGSPATGRGKRVRRRGFLRFSYGLIYALTDSLVYIVAVSHDSRRPGYWAKRLRDIPPS